MTDFVTLNLLRGHEQVSHRPLDGSCMKHVGQIAGGASSRLRAAGSARDFRGAVDFALVLVRGGTSARSRAARSASPRSVTTPGSHSDTGMRV